MRAPSLVYATVLIVAGGIAFVGCNTADAQVDAPSDVEMPAVTKQARFFVDGMTCTSCNVTVKMAAEKVDGVVKAGASHAKKTAWAVFDPAKTNPAAIAKAITDAGYPATVTD